MPYGAKESLISSEQETETLTTVVIRNAVLDRIRKQYVCIADP